MTLLLARVLWPASCRDHRELRAIKRQKVARHIDKRFGAAGYPGANSGVRAIEEIRAVLDGRVDAILRLQAAIRSDNAGIGDIGPVGRISPALFGQRSAGVRAPSGWREDDVAIRILRTIRCDHPSDTDEFTLL